MKRPWIIYTAGVLGAGKSYTIRKLSELELFPLLAFVLIDTDQIKCLLPEMKEFIKDDPLKAGDLTNKEALLITEIAEREAIKMNKCVLVDGSFREISWYRKRLEHMAEFNTNYYRAIIHVTAEPQLIFDRIARRSLQTDRVVSASLLESDIEKIEKSVKALEPHVLFTVTFNNDQEDTQLVKQRRLEFGTASDAPRIVYPELKMMFDLKNIWFKERFQNVWDHLKENKKDSDKDELKAKLENFGSKDCSMNGGYYGKYIKYKAKYLNLKQRFN